MNSLFSVVSSIFNSSSRISSSRTSSSIWVSCVNIFSILIVSWLIIVSQFSWAYIDVAIWNTYIPIITKQTCIYQRRICLCFWAIFAEWWTTFLPWAVSLFVWWIIFSFVFFIFCLNKIHNLLTIQVYLAIFWGQLWLYRRIKKACFFLKLFIIDWQYKKKTLYASFWRKCFLSKIFVFFLKSLYILFTDL